MPYILLFSLLLTSFLLLRLSLFYYYTNFCAKAQEPKTPMKSGFFSSILHLSLFLFFYQGHLCALCPHRGFCAVSLCKDALVFIPAKPVYYGYSNQQNAPQKTAVLCDTGKGEFIMARVYNFSAGPSMLPEKVLKQAQAELLEYGDSGQSVMEMSHRSKWFDAIIKDTEATLRRVMNIPDNYKVGFFQGGATQQFAMVPLNFMTTGKADYLVTGNFSNLAAKEAAKFGEVNIVASSKDKNFTYIPDVNAINYDKDASYIHICQNNTIFGTQFVEVPQVEGVPLVADMSSMILSKPVDVTKYGCIYFGVQKNVAPAGMAIAIVRDDLLGHAADNVPTMMNYTTLLVHLYDRSGAQVSGKRHRRSCQHAEDQRSQGQGAVRLSGRSGLLHESCGASLPQHHERHLHQPQCRSGQEVLRRSCRSRLREPERPSSGGRHARFHLQRHACRGCG